MNSSPSTPNLESLRQAVQDFTPNPRRVPFNNLKPVHDAILELRGKNASYSIIAELLMQNGVKTSRARVAEYGRIVLEDGKKRKRRKRAKAVPAANTPAVPQSAPTVAAKPAPATAPASNGSPPASENTTHKWRGPRIANVKMMTASEREAFEASLKSKTPAPKPAPEVCTPNSLPPAAKPERGPHIAKVELLPPGENCD
jgi:hypothetical protein